LYRYFAFKSATLRKAVRYVRVAADREGAAAVGCTRAVAEVWLIGEVIALEISVIGGFRKKTRKPVLGCLSLQIRPRNDSHLEKGGAYLKE
jgi:hypothetical protein